MQDENSKGLQNLINSIKSQPPILPIEGIADISKGFFSASKSWFKSWMKPVGAAAAGVAIMVAAFLFVKEKRTNEVAKDTTFMRVTGDGYRNATDDLEATKSTPDSIMPLVNEMENIGAILNHNNINPTQVNVFVPLAYKLTSNDSTVLNSFGAEVQTFEIDARYDTMITGKLGTKLVFYQSCFEDSVGNVVKSNVQITLKECYNYPDMVKENLNTQCDSGYLESKGMIWVDAQSDGRALALREGFDMPIEFASNNTEDYNLYYANSNKYNQTNWEFDSLGKVPNPVIATYSGRYWDISFNYFLDNYKLNKSAMLDLYEKNWELHFTSSQNKMIGYTACKSGNINMNIACVKFRDLCEDIYDEVPLIKQSSWITEFGFACISRDSLNRWLENDTIRRKVDKAIFAMVMNSPFYATRLGWSNCDRPINAGFLVRERQTVALANYPAEGYTKTYLLLKNKKSIANPTGNISRPLFLNLPRNEEAILFSYKLVDGKIWYVQMDINTSTDVVTLGDYEPVEDAETLIAKIDALTRPYLE